MPGAVLAGYQGHQRIVSASDIAAFTKNIAERPPQPARLILDPLDRKLVHNTRDMDRLSRHAGSISLSSNRLCIHDHHAGQTPKARAMNHSGIGYTGLRESGNGRSGQRSPPPRAMGRSRIRLLQTQTIFLFPTGE